MENFKLTKGLKWNKYQKYCCDFFPLFAFCLVIFLACHAKHFLGSHYDILNLLQSLGVHNMLLGMLCEIMSVKDSRLEI